MAKITAEQVVLKLKHNGAFDAMRKTSLSGFIDSAQGKVFDSSINELLEHITSKEYDSSRWINDPAYLERRLIDYLGRTGDFDRLEKDVRNHWLSGKNNEQLNEWIIRAIDNKVHEGSNSVDLTKALAISRKLELDGPRGPVRSSDVRPGAKTHHYYKRGETVATFVPVGDPLCDAKPDYICVAVEITACDAPKNIYTVKDNNCDSGNQHTWAVYWDQILIIKRAYDQVYRQGDQVYALYRDPEVTFGTAKVSTEYFPATVMQASPSSIAVLFEDGSVSHVYYDELFAAGRVGFLRKLSEIRKRHHRTNGKENAPYPNDAFVVIQGREIPSFLGFWPNVAIPGLEKHGRKAQYRPLPQFIVEPRRAVSYAASAVSSDMDIGDSSASPSVQGGSLPPSVKSSSPVATPKKIEAPTAAIPDPPTILTEPPVEIQAQTANTTQQQAQSAISSPEKQPSTHSPSGEEGEVGSEEEGEVGEITSDALKHSALDPASPIHRSSPYQDRRRLHATPQSGRSRTRWDSNDRRADSGSSIPRHYRDTDTWNARSIDRRDCSRSRYERTRYRRSPSPHSAHYRDTQRARDRGYYREDRRGEMVRRVHDAQSPLMYRGESRGMRRERGEGGRYVLDEGPLMQMGGPPHEFFPRQAFVPDLQQAQDPQYMDPRYIDQQHHRHGGYR